MSKPNDLLSEMSSATGTPHVTASVEPQSAAARRGRRPRKPKPLGPCSRRMGAAAILCVAALVTLRAAGPVPQSGTALASPPADLASAITGIDALAADGLARENVGGLTIGIIADDRLAWTRSYGLADLETRVPATADTVYRIGSITKQFTALMLLQLVEQGKVRLSDPVDKYLPEVHRVRGMSVDAPPITLGQLATMTSGLEREPGDMARYVKGPVAEWEKTLISALPSTHCASEPGTTFRYSNIGYAILGAALARAAGQPYVHYVQQHVFAPLGMLHTAFEPTAVIRPLLAKGYEIVNPRTAAGGPTGEKPARLLVDRDTPAGEHEGRGYRVPNGGIYTTVGDLASFVAFELGAQVPAVLKKATLDDAYAEARSSPTVLRTGYGIGFQVIRRGDLFVYGHAGTVIGYAAAAYYERVSRTGVVVLRNIGGGSLDVNALAIQAVERLAAARKAGSRR